MLSFNVDRLFPSVEGTVLGGGSNRGEEKKGGQEGPVFSLRHLSLSGDSFYNQHASGHRG